LESDANLTDLSPEGPGQGQLYTRLGASVWILGAVMVVMGIVTSILMLQDFESNSYYYLAFYSIPSNTAITVFPHEPVLFYFGKFANLWLTAAAATAGTVVAGIMDHAVFVPVLNLQSIQSYKEKKFYRASIRYFMRWPFATLFVVGFTPVPFFPFKFLSFSMHYPMWKYVAALIVSRFPRYYLLAWLGMAFQIPTWILVASFVVIIGMYAWKAIPAVYNRWRARRRRVWEPPESPVTPESTPD
jgi:membrane protein YqaA with SNARE-associated domain